MAGPKGPALRLVGRVLRTRLRFVLEVSQCAADCSCCSSVVCPWATNAQDAPPALKQTAYIKASNADAYDHFACGGGNQGHRGDSIAISRDGSTMAVGAPYESSNARGINGNQNDNSMYASGAVYVFTHQGGVWTEQAYVKASNPGQSDHFGSSVTLSADGNTMAVAAYFESSASAGVNGNQDDDSLKQSGAVYVFTRRGTTWSQQAYIKTSTSEGGDLFGFSVAIINRRSIHRIVDIGI